MVYRDWKMNEAFFGDDLSEIGNGGLRHRQLAPGKFPGNFLGGGSTHEDRVVGSAIVGRAVADELASSASHHNKARVSNSTLMHRRIPPFRPLTGFEKVGPDR